MNDLIFLANSIAVCIFGGVLSAAFCGALGSRRDRWSVALGICLLLAVQGGCSLILGEQLVEELYPLITHVPLALLLCILTRRRLWPFVSVLIAYLCCQLRYWLGLLGTMLLHGDAVTQAVGELAVTLPLLILLLRFVAPAVYSLEQRPAGVEWGFGLIPFIYYAFDYVSTVYTDLLSQGNLAAMEFMPFVCCAIYLVFVLRAFTQERERFQMERIQNALDIQVSQAMREISALRESQTQASTYRHDLRHHLQYISSCIENNQLPQAQAYIHSIYEQIEAQKIHVYCENEAANLIFSAFAGRCAKSGVTLKIQATLPPFLSVSSSDLCVLLSNALENALNACLTMTGERSIDVLAYEKEHKLFLQVTNPCQENIGFEDGLPVTDRPGHGIGVRSIRAIAEHYGGLYSFSVQNGQFVLRMSL